jgi:hypothetical protein
MPLRIATLCFATLLFVASPSPGQQVRVTGIFSDMRWIKEAGDVIGAEVFIVATGSDYRAVVQIAQGVPDVPVVVPLTVRGTEVSFTLPTYDNLKFSGRVTQTALVGTLGAEKVTLRRGKSYWQ